MGARMSGPDWLKGNDPLPDPHGRGERAVQFLTRLKLHEGKYDGQPFELAPWQERLVRRVYGDTRSDGRRRVRTVFVLLPRGNGKTTLSAALGLLHTFGPESEAAGQIIAAAADREQASIAYTTATRMVEKDATLSRITKVTPSGRKIAHPASGSIFKAISHEAYSKHGMSISCLIADEVHAWPTRELWDVLTSSMGKRDEPLTIVITTAGVGVHGLAYELYDYAKRVQSGAVEDETFLPVLFEGEKDADWKDEQLWQAVNPAIASGFRSLEEMQIMARRAAEVPAQLEAFKRLYLNIWSDGAPDPWLDLDVYDEGSTPFDLADLEGEPCFLGVDLSSTQDLTAVVAAFPRPDGELLIAPWFFVPADSLRRRQERDQIPYLTWADQGLIEATAGNVVDYDQVESLIFDLAERFRVEEVAIDRWNSTATTNRLQEAGLTVAAFGQGMKSMSPAVKETERLILARKFVHGGNPVLRWNFSNVVIETDAAANRKPSKAKSAEKIDGAVATLMAVSRALAGEAGPSVYEEEGRGFTFF